MKDFLKFVFIFISFVSGRAHAGYSSRYINVPSPQFQERGRFNFESSTYFSIGSPAVALGTTVGIWSAEQVRFEAGLDWDEHLYNADKILKAHIKAGLAEQANIPAFAMGIFHFGFKPGEGDLNIIYGLVGKTFQSFGSPSLGFYVGNPALLKDEKLAPDNKGFLLAWQRRMTEVSSKGHLVFDWISGFSIIGTFSAAIQYDISSEALLKVGYMTFNNVRLKSDMTFVRIEMDL